MKGRQQELMFELLQIALGQRESFTCDPSKQEWEKLYEMTCKQAVAGVAFYGLELLGQKGIKPPQVLLLKWIGQCEMLVRQRNAELDRKCVELQGIINKAGYNCSILKGQGIARLYNSALCINDTGKLASLRQPGDIDVYVDCGLDKAISFARAQGRKDIQWDYKHLHLGIWKNVDVELHYRIEVLFNLCKNRRLQKWFEENNDKILGSRINVDGDEVVVPTVEFDVFYILLHIYRHFFTEGVGIRQLLDYYFVLCAVYKERLKVDYYVEAVRQFGMERFAMGLMWVLNEIFAMPKDWMLWEINEKEGRFIMTRVLVGGNFGHYSPGHKRSGNKFNYVMNRLANSMALILHHPYECFWSQFWLPWHKGWKIYKIIRIKE